MQYKGIDATYPFEIPDILCPTVAEMARLIGVAPERVKTWESNGDIPTRTRTGLAHDAFWTTDKAKEAFIQGYILCRRGD